MATRTWTGGTGTWDATDGTHWSASTAPIAGDAVVFDGTSGGGTVTVAADVAGIAFLSLTAGAFTGTLAFNTNNPNMTFAATSGNAVSFTGSGARVINMGSGTWTFSGGGSFDCGTVTSLTPTFSNAPIVMNGNVVSRSFLGGGQTYNTITVGSNSTKGFVNFTGANTFSSVTAASGNALLFPQGTTTTISGALAMTGTSSAPVGLQSNGPPTNATTVSVGSASTIDWGGILRVTRSGAGTLTATNSFDMGGNTSFTSITAPSGGGSSGGQRVISG